MRDAYSCQEPVPKHGDMLEDTIVSKAWLKAIDPETARPGGLSCSTSHSRDEKTGSVKLSHISTQWQC